MSQAQGIPLSHPHSTSRFRLIELPPGLDTLLTSPGAPRLTLESSDDAAILKTPDKTYALRQKNTSNALILLRPGGRSGDGLETVGTVHETVELEAVPDRSVDGGSAGSARHTGSKGKWHEKFGKGR
ncbi:sister chromatid cohesion protein dcc1 domain-containing protein [Sarocladium implicatum]|nr:sister chromatid cohesion protein dcc1 domain-containing protein [Sarocladium implicatum]